MATKTPKVAAASPPAGNGTPSTRDAILAAARQIMVEEGLLGVSTRRIARKAQVNQALVHYHFGSTENLMLEVLNGLAASLRTRQNDVFTGPDNLPTKWRRYITNLIEIDIPQGAPKVWLEVVALVSNSEHAALFIDTVAGPWYERIRAAVQTEFPSSDARDIDALTGLITTVYRSIIVDRLLGWERGHPELIQLMETILANPPKLSTAGPQRKPAAQKRPMSPVKTAVKKRAPAVAKSTAGTKTATGTAARPKAKSRPDVDRKSATRR